MTTNIFATNNTQIKWGAKLIGGVGNIYYYMDSSVISSYKTATRNAANNWMYTGFGANPIYMYEYGNTTGTKMDLYGKYSGNNGILATTVTYSSMDDSAPVPLNKKDTVNWAWGKITFNNSLTKSSRQGVTAHEMGHVFGLRDINKTSSIMNYYDTGLVKVTKDAHDAINQKY